MFKKRKKIIAKAVPLLKLVAYPSEGLAACCDTVMIIDSSLSREAILNIVNLSLGEELNAVMIPKEELEK